MIINNSNFYIHNILEIFHHTHSFKGWGRKKTGRFAAWCQSQLGGEVELLEDGFIRSIGLGVNDSPSFSRVKDDVGIYYDATTASKLENILNTYDFTSNIELMEKSSQAIRFIKKHHISKYNHARAVNSELFQENKKRVLVIAQTAGDASLKYGLGETYSTDDMIDAAIIENPAAVVYLKVHPDVISGKKKSDIDIVTSRQKCTIIEEDVNPLSLLEYFETVYTKTSQMGFEALLLGKKCVCFGMPFYAGWGVTDDRVRCERRERILNVKEIFAAAYILYSQYYNPYSQKSSDIMDTLETIVRYKEREKNQNYSAYFFGFSRWKHVFMMPFLKFIDPKKVHFISPILGSEHLDVALKRGLDKDAHIFIWGKKEFDGVENFAIEKQIPVYRIEDGFIRSVGLGSDLTQPYSLVIDSSGIYFDPTHSSDLESLLQTYQFDEKLLARADAIKSYLVENKLSKYNLYENKILDFPRDKKIIMVPGQVEDDASIRYGANGMTNLQLLKQVRQNAPHDYIVYKPHPDVLVGNRVGHIENADALRYCDRIVTEVGIDAVLEKADEVHTMTSLVGFEALLRNKKVYTYGIPFYAGWGLTTDMRKCSRRTRKLELNELIAATYILYPRYIDPETLELCEVEVVLEKIEHERQRFQKSKLYRLKKRVRNTISRKIQLTIKVLRSIK